MDQMFQSDNTAVYDSIPKKETVQKKKRSQKRNHHPKTVLKRVKRHSPSAKTVVAKSCTRGKTINKAKKKKKQGSKQKKRVRRKERL